MGVNSSTFLQSYTVHATASGPTIPPECPAHKSQAPVSECPVAHGSSVSECPVGHGSSVSECPIGHGSSMSECPATIELKQSTVPETDIDPANMVSQ